MTEGDKLHFDRVCRDVIMAEKSRAGIGTYQEKTLHSVLKCFICEDKSCHEVKVYSDVPCDGEPAGRETSYIADVLHDCDIYEIQTGGLYPLRDKIRFYLEQTGYNVTVICPIAANKRVRWIDPETSEISDPHRSPKKQSERELLPELFWLLPYLNNRRLTVRAVLLEIEEYRLKNGWGNDGKRGSHRYERIPTALVGIHDFASPADYMHLLPADLPDGFTVSEFGKQFRMSGKKLYAAIKVFCEVGLLCQTGKRGRALTYTKK